MKQVESHLRPKKTTGPIEKMEYLALSHKEKYLPH